MSRTIILRSITSAKVVVGLLGLFVLGCPFSGSGTSDPDGITSGEMRATTKLTQNTIETVHGILAAAAVSRPASGEKADSASFKVSYNVSVNVSLRYFDNANNEQAIYNPNTTVKIVATGSGTGTDVTLSFQYTITGTQASSRSVTVNGDSNGTWDGVSLQTTLYDVVVPKQLCAMPTSGRAVARTAAGLKVSLTFNGGSTIQATVSYGSYSDTFTVAVTSCTVTRD
ncbi:MAG: hypothetical protein HYV63_34390 [Candidatus Schekmanbacteria bacterium]|nr:hypothetical protein [Candidatus Schekmanbacteria bacterium]